MEGNKNRREEAITSEEINASVLPGHMASKPLSDSQSRNAFTELMSSPQKSKVKSTPRASATQVVPTWPPNTPYTGRNSLGAYIAAPSKYPAVIYQDEQFVAIYDGFPKSSVHVLLLPRDLTKTLLHPFEAFEDIQFLEAVKVETRKLKSLVASELRRKYGKESATEQARIQAMNIDPPLDTLPPGRDWEKDIICGIHIGPSMNHLHIHVLSVDRYSPCLRHRKHYNSFSTPFLLDVEDFPLSAEDPRRSREHGYLKRDLVCWRCGQNFGNSFVQLKDHLEKEFEEWKCE